MDRSTPTRKRNATTADVHDYFTTETVNEQCRRKCVLYSVMYIISSSTSTLRSHSRIHGFLLEEDTQKLFMADGSLQATVQMPKRELEERVVQQICSWVVSSSLPFSSVEEAEFLKLINIICPEVSTPSRSTVSRRVRAMQQEKGVSMKSFLSNVQVKIRLATDAWSSKVFEGFVAITAHSRTEDWKLVSIALDFMIFMTPHTFEATCALLQEFIQSWDIEGRVSAITTENASDVCSGVSTLLTRLVSEGQESPNLEDFYDRCIADVVNIAVKECMGMIREEIGQIRSLVNSVRASVKCRDLFENIPIELGERAALPFLDVETHWSSTFVMMKSAFTARRIFNAVCNRSRVLYAFIIP